MQLIFSQYSRRFSPKISLTLSTLRTVVYHAQKYISCSFVFSAVLDNVMAFQGTCLGLLDLGVLSIL